MKIIVTGSHGYIGSVLCPQLIKNGYSVLGIDNGYFFDCKIKDVKKETTFKRKNLSDVSEKNFRNIDAVIHLAGLQNDPLKNTFPGKVYDVEFQYTKKIAQICKKFQIKFIFISSCSIYGSSNQELLNENSHINPLTPYSSNKLRIENYLKSIRSNNFNPIMLRFATVYGFSPRMRFDLYINQFIAMTLSENKIHLNSDGKAWRPNLYIQDIPLVLEKVLKKDFSEPAIINIGNDKSNFQIKNVVREIKNIHKDLSIKFLGINKKSLYKDHYVVNKKDRRSYSVDFSKMKKFLGNNVCPTGIDTGLKNLSDDLEKISDIKNKIKDPRFFRLQWTQKLLDNKIIDKKFKYFS